MRKVCHRNERERRHCEVQQRALDRERRQVCAQRTREEEEVRSNLRRLERERCANDLNSDDDEFDAGFFVLTSVITIIVVGTQ